MFDLSLQFSPTDIVQKNFAFFENVHNSYLIDIFYHCDSCCHEVEMSGVEFLKRDDACVFRFKEILFFFQIIVPDSRL